MSIILTDQENALLTSIESQFGEGSLEWNAVMDMIKDRAHMKLFIVCQYKTCIDEGGAWEFSGAFDNEEEAIKSCGGYKNYFIGQVELNKPLHHETVEWPGCYYPHAEEVV